MKIKHFLYNAFIIEENNQKIAIDPGKNLWIFKLNSLIPMSEWDGLTHILITHGDPDHFEYAILMAKQSGAEVICGTELVEDFYTANVKNVKELHIGETVHVKNIKVQGLKTSHGPLPIKLAGGLIEMKNELRESNVGGQEVFIGPIRVNKVEKEMKVRTHGSVKLLFGLIRAEKDNVPFAKGAIGFKITIGEKTVVNLGDTCFNKEWEGLQPDVLMIPIGGVIGNTMDVRSALEAVKIIEPKLVIPMHYNVPFLWNKNINPTDDQNFKAEVEKMGIECLIMDSKGEIEIA